MKVTPFCGARGKSGRSSHRDGARQIRRGRRVSGNFRDALVLPEIAFSRRGDAPSTENVSREPRSHLNRFRECV